MRHFSATLKTLRQTYYKTMKQFLPTILFFSLTYIAHGQIDCGMTWPKENLRPDTVSTFLFTNKSLSVTNFQNAKPTSNFSFRTKLFDLTWMPIYTSHINDFIDGSLKNIEKKPVFVEMLPKQETTIKESVKPLTDTLSDNMKKYGDPDNSVRSVFDSKEIDLKTNYSRPLDEIKEMYVKSLGKKEELKKSIIKIQLPPQVKKLVLYTGLVITGALMMLLIKNTESKSIASVMPDYKKPDTVIITAAAQPTGLDENIVSTTESYEKQNFPPEEQKQPVVLNKNMPLKKTVEKNETTDVDNEKAEKNKKPANEIKVLKTVTLENISSKLALKANDYNVGSFGGIRNLEMTLQNNSKYLLDRVTVEISYLNPEGIILKTDNIYFQSIQPGDATVIPVNKTKRGVKVNYKITKIESKELVSDNSKTAEPNNYTSN